MLAKLKWDEAVGNFRHQISEDPNGSSLPTLTPKLWLYWCLFERSSTMEAYWNSLDDVGLWKFDGFITDVQFLLSSGILDPGRNACGNIPAKAWGTAEPKRAVVPALKLSLTKIDELQFQFPPPFCTPTSLCSGFVSTLWTWPDRYGCLNHPCIWLPITRSRQLGLFIPNIFHTPRNVNSQGNARSCTCGDDGGGK